MPLLTQPTEEEEEYYKLTQQIPHVLLLIVKLVPHQTHHSVPNVTEQNYYQLIQLLVSLFVEPALKLMPLERNV